MRRHLCRMVRQRSLCALSDRRTFRVSPQRNGVLPGTYVLEISSLPQDFYLKAARFGADDVLEKPLTFDTGDAANRLQVLLASNGGRLQAAAFNRRGEPESGAQFVLVPDVTRHSRREQYRVA